MLLLLSLVGQSAGYSPVWVDTAWIRDTVTTYSGAEVVQDSWRVPPALEAMVAQAYAEGYRTGYNAAVVLANEKLAEAKARHIADLRAIKAQLDEIRAGLKSTPPPRGSMEEAEERSLRRLTALARAAEAEEQNRKERISSAVTRWPYQEWRR
jgi:hypothetical protein